MCACSKVIWDNKKKRFVCASCGCRVSTGRIERLYSAGWVAEQNRMDEKERTG